MARRKTKKSDVGRSRTAVTRARVRARILAYLDAANLTQDDLARRAFVSKSVICHVIAKRKAVGPDVAIALERATSGALQAVELSPRLAARANAAA